MAEPESPRHGYQHQVNVGKERIKEARRQYYDNVDRNGHEQAPSYTGTHRDRLGQE